jgi:hypothetical protein
MNDATFLLVVVLCLTVWLIAVSCTGSLFYRYEQSDFNEWALSQHVEGSKYETMHNIITWMQAHMQYEPDGIIDYFKHPLKTWWQRGDCEDWAGVCIEALAICGYTDFWLQSVWYHNDGHTVCTNGIYHLGNWGLHPVATVTADAEQNVAYTISGDWEAYTIRDRNLNKIKHVRRQDVATGRDDKQ